MLQMADAKPTRPLVRPEGLSLKEVAIILGVHEETVRRWWKAGVIAGERVGPKLIRIPRSELARLRIRPHSST